MTKRNYKTGYGRPPKNRQWKKGQSGNPNGRPPKKEIRLFSLRDAFLEEMQEILLVRINGKDVFLPKYMVMVKAFSSKALKGDIKAAKFIETYIPQESEIIPTPTMIIRPPSGSTNKDSPDFDPESIPPPIYGEEDD